MNKENLIIYLLIIIVFNIMLWVVYFMPGGIYSNSNVILLHKIYIILALEILLIISILLTNIILLITK